MPTDADPLICVHCRSQLQTSVGTPGSSTDMRKVPGSLSVHSEGGRSWSLATEVPCWVCAAGLAVGGSQGLPVGIITPSNAASGICLGRSRAAGR